MLAGESDRDDAERAASSAGRPPSADGIDAAPTPRPTKILLVATLVLTAAALAVFLSGGDRKGDARFAVWFLLLFSALFLARVLGQVAVVLARPSWLPPAHQWNLMPYPVLLPAQIAILAVMAAIEVAFFRGRGILAEPRPTLGTAIVVFSFVYAGAMVVRYAVRMRRRPGERWFGGTIPITFHFVLAAFLFVLGTYHGDA